MSGGSRGLESGEGFRWAFRWSVRGGALVGGLFFLVAVVRTITAGGGVLDHLAPTLAMTVIGMTVGALAGPLVGGGLARRRSRREGDAGAEEG